MEGKCSDCSVWRVKLWVLTWLWIVGRDVFGVAYSGGDVEVDGIVTVVC